MTYRSPAFEGDLSLLNGEVLTVDESGPIPIVTLRIEMTNQKGEVMATGDAKVRLPTEDHPEP
jgi:acyl dehydratase